MMGGMENLEKYLEDLASEDPAHRRAAAEALCAGDERSIYPLIRALRDENTGVQDAAMRSLGAIGGEVTAYMVLPLLREEALLRNAAIVILRQIGLPAVPLLRPLFKDKDDDVRKFATDLLCDIGHCDDPYAITFLIAGDPNANVRAAAARAAGVLLIREALPQLRAALNDEEWVRFNALESIAAMQDLASADDVVALLSSPSEATRYAAIECLGALGTERCGAALVAYLGRAGGDERFLTVKSLIQAGVPMPGPGVSPILLDAFKSGGWEDRLIALKGLAEIKEERAIFPIIDAAGDLDPSKPEDEEILEAVRRSLVAYGPTGALIRAITDPTIKYRGKVIVAQVSGEVKDAEAVPGLVELLKTDLRDVRRASAWALGEIGGEEARRALTEALDDRDSHVRRLSAAALRRWQDRGCFDLLMRRLGEEKHYDVLEEVVAALLASDRDAVLSRAGAFDRDVQDLVARLANGSG